MRWRVCWTVVSLIVVETIVIATALVLVVAAWFLLAPLPVLAVRLVVFALTAGPSYLVFALTLMTVSAIATEVLGWRAPLRAEMRITDLEWPLLNWYGALPSIMSCACWQDSCSAELRFGASICGSVAPESDDVSTSTAFRWVTTTCSNSATTWSLAPTRTLLATRLNGVLKTAPVRFGPRVMVGVGSIVDIGVTVGAGCQIGALSLVPKHVTLAAGAVYVGVPARRIDGRRMRSTKSPIEHDVSREGRRLEEDSQLARSSSQAGLGVHLRRESCERTVNAAGGQRHRFEFCSRQNKAWIGRAISIVVKQAESWDTHS